MRRAGMGTEEGVGRYIIFIREARECRQKYAGDGRDHHAVKKARQKRGS